MRPNGRTVPDCWQEVDPFGFFCDLRLNGRCRGSILSSLHDGPAFDQP